MTNPIESQPQEVGGRPRPSFAVVLTWPELPNAEFEVVQRICKMGTNIGALVWVVDNDGYPLSSNQDGVALPKRRLTRDDCTFVLSLHFESPRLYDIPSYTALWNPPDFYLAFGYARTIEQLASHIDVLSCRSDVADAHAANIYAGLGRALCHPFPALFHGVPRPYLAPRQEKSSRLFYVGVNWERVTGEKGRHHELLEQLDSEDLIHIYGPEKILGVAPWRGFSTYRGSIPFDGESVVARINEAGICLALSSTSHQTSGIMSNRLFEALAAGAVVIANPHPFITKYFSDVVHVVDDRGPVADVVAQIRDLVLEVRSNPHEARARASAGQQRLLEGFSLEESFTNLFAVHAKRLAHAVNQTTGSERHEVSLILDASDPESASVEKLLASLSAQSFVAIDLLVLGPRDVLDRMQGLGPAIRSTHLFELELDVRQEGKASRRSAASGQAFARALAAVRTPYFCTMQSDDDCFGDHLASLANKLASTPDSSFACSGKLVEQLDKRGVARRRFDSLTFDHLEALAEAAYPRDVGRFMFRSSLIAKLPHTVFGLLDRMEHRLLELWALLDGPLAQTHYASYLRALDVTTELPAPFFPEAQQTEVIRDTVRGRAEWLTLVGTLRQFRPQAPTNAKLAALRLGRTHATRKEGDGLPLLAGGFSVPEDSGTWIEGLEGTIAFEIADLDKPQQVEIVLFTLGRTARADDAFQCCSVTVNGQAAGQILVGTQPAQFRIPVPATTDLHGSLTIKLRLRHAEQVVDDRGKLVDDRRLGLHLISFGLEAASSQRAPALALDHSYALQLEGDGVPFAIEGFSHPEAEVTWMHGPTATLAFTLDASSEQLDLVLIGIGRSVPGGMASQPCTISLDGTIVGRVAFTEELDRQSIPLPAIYGGRPYRLTMDLRPGKLPCQTGVAGPLIGGSVALHRFGLFRSTRDASPSRPPILHRVLRAVQHRVRQRR